MSELKPCPFCGCDHVSFIETEEQPLENSTQGFIYCHGCGFSSDIFLDLVIAKQHWNRRAQHAEPLTCEGCENQKHDGFNYEVCIRCKRHWPDRYAHKPGGEQDAAG